MSPPAEPPSRRAANPPATVLQTARLVLRELTPDDAPFIRVLLNDPDFIRFVADRGVRTDDDARRYIADGPMAMFARLGIGLMLVVLRDGGSPVGICGLLRRDGLDDPDLGFAFLPDARGRGYATEAGGAVLGHARRDLGIGRIVAITSQANHASGRVLSRLGFRRDGTIALPSDPETLDLYASDA